VALLPSQEPAQAVPSVAQAARPPCGRPLVTVVQVPTLVATSQAWHCPAQATLQQTPSTHWPLVQALAPAQAWPLAFLAMQTPPEHHWPEAQPASLVQLPAQAVVPQTYGVQAWVPAAGQAPAPSQAVASEATPPVQDGARHSVELPG
jgi:hypothetical protein